jgi:MFS family permease
VFSPQSPFHYRDYRAFWATRLTNTVASAVLVLVLGFEVYDLARQTMSIKESAFMLGMIGLAQFVPLFALTLVTGYVADRIDRRWIVRGAVLLELLCAAALAWLAWTDRMTMTALFAVAILLGVGRAFAAPAMSALGPNLVPRAILPTAIAWNSIAWQVGAVGGPALGGYLYAGEDWLAYAVSAALYGGGLVALFLIRPVARPPLPAGKPWQAVVDGLAYTKNNRIVLGAISLDLFAVLLGGATAMLPIYARDILMVGPEGLGHLRAAPAAGAALTAMFLARRPLARNVGIWMFGAVALFGVATIVFGVSTHFGLSLIALAAVGASDMISVYVRSSLIQLHTPDAMRGRVSAVSTLFISASNELGEFQSGVAAAILGPVPSVVFGGIGAIVVTGVWAWRFPELRRADRFEVPDKQPA